jgi:peptide/nickel transport system permease protein
MATWIIVLGIAVPFGTILGLFAGYLGGKYDELIMRVTDIFLAFPSLILSLAVAAALGPSLTNAFLALTIVWWPSYTRLVRGQAISIRESAYIEAARSMGASHTRIIFSHILPNCISPLIISMTQEIGLVILTGSGLSFLGFGAQPPLPEWGRMITEGRIYIFDAWWMTFFPGLALLMVVLAFNLLGDTLRDLLDPRLRRVVEVHGT